MATNDLSHLTTDELCKFLSGRIHEAAELTLREQCISGAIFCKLTDTDLKELLPQIGPRLSVSVILRELQPVHASNRISKVS